MSREDEARLGDRLIAGDPSAFRDLVTAYQRKVYGLAYEMTRNHADAEDISQVTFMKIHRSIGTLKPGLGLKTWIYQIAHNSAIDHIRKKRFFPAQAQPALSSVPLFEDPADPSAGPEQEAETAGLRRRIDEALGGFSERERAVFILRHYHDLKLKEIAEALHVSLGTAKSYLFRSLRKLQKTLDDLEPRLDKGDRP
jgi:RNA polymerase sigma-70 factor (ECF subfamily)